ncbi:MAG: hypothetical protein AAFQ87_17655 [Bacteroidota bacterium]
MGLLLLFIRPALPAQSWQLNRDSSSVEFMSIKVWPLFAERQNEAASLQVFASDTLPEDLPPMLGRYEQREDSLIFKPRFPYQPGRQYLLYLPQSGELHSFVYTFGERSNSAGPVLHMYPSTDTLPANQLKFYLAFREAVPLHSPYPYIWLEDAQGRRLEQVFLPNDPPLWDPTHRRLTLWFEPGRIKRGLIPHQQLGPPLEAGNQYQLVVDLAKLYNPQAAESKLWRRAFYAGEADRSRPNHHDWQVRYPKTDTRDTLVILFPESLDYGTLQTGLLVEDVIGNELDGEVFIGSAERSWQFVPAHSWKAGDYRIRIWTQIEDLAANNLERLFDTGPDDKISTFPQTWIEYRFTLSP